MKLQLNEHTLNAYINEAIRQELEESKATAGEKVAREIINSPITKKVTGRIKAARQARKFTNGLRRGKPVSGTIESGKYKGYKWQTSDGGKNFKFFDRTGKEITTATKNGETVKLNDPQRSIFKAASKSLKSHKAYAANLYNSAQRNMLGTGLVAGMGTGWAIDHAKNSSHPDDPWNAGSGDPGANGNNEDGGTNPGWDGTFPWDNTEPQWAPPRQRKNTGTASTNVDTGTSIQSTSQDSTQQKREIPGAIQPTTRQLNIPTGAVARTQETLPRPTDDAFHKNVARNMLNTASLSAGDASQREKNSAIRQITKNGIASTRSQNYDGLNPKGDRKFIRNARNTILRGNQNPNI